MIDSPYGIFMSKSPSNDNVIPMQNQGYQQQMGYPNNGYSQPYSGPPIQQYNPQQYYQPAQQNMQFHNPYQAQVNQQSMQTSGQSANTGENQHYQNYVNTQQNSGNMQNLDNRYQQQYYQQNIAPYQQPPNQMMYQQQQYPPQYVGNSYNNSLYQQQYNQVEMGTLKERQQALVKILEKR